MRGNRQIERDLVDLLDHWLAGPVGQTSVERSEIVAVREKLERGSGSITDDEKEAAIACVMESVDVESDVAQSIIDYLDEAASS